MSRVQQQNRRRQAEKHDVLARSEMARWASLEKNAYKGLINESAMMWALRQRFPLRFIVFKQTASHIPHEANMEEMERLLSRMRSTSQTPTWTRTSWSSSHAASPPTKRHE